MKSLGGIIMRTIDEIIVHCTATRPEWMAGKGTLSKVHEVAKWHTRDRGWRAIGYHRLIDRDGMIANGRPIQQVGAHVKGHNSNSIGIALFGGHGGAADQDFLDSFTPAQDRALREEIARLRSIYPTIKKVTGHNEYAAKACPCFDVSDWMGDKPEPATQNPFAALIAALLAIFGKAKK